VDRESCELLRAIVRRPSGPDAQSLHRLAENIRDWEALLELAGDHRVLPMLYRRLADLGPAVPEAAIQAIEAAYHRNMILSMVNAAELIGLLEAFDREGIPAMPFKGVVLSASLYGDLTSRAAGDLDVLIHQRHLERATAILEERGFELKTPANADGAVDPHCFEHQFERPRDGMMIELRWRLELTYARFRRNLGMDWVWSRRRMTKLAGAEVPGMDPEITLLMLCMHGSKHVWSRLNWICDVGQLLASFPDLNWKEVTREAQRVGLWRPLVLGVLLAHRITGATVPQVVLERFESDITACRLARHVQEHLFDAPGSTPASRMPYYVQLLGFRDRVRLLLSRGAVRPNARDRAALELSPSFDFLYYLVRPVRIFRDRSARR